MQDIIIVGGGLGGLISALCLSKENWRVTLIEQKKYPFHRVCGEYVSMETVPFLKRIGAFPSEIELPYIDKLTVSSPSGKTINLPLDLGGFGISRFYFDHFLYQQLLKTDVEVLIGEKVRDVTFQGDHFSVNLDKGRQMESRLVIGAFGKRSTLDSTMERSFIKKKSPYLGVKYHIKTDFPNDRIALHNFKDGYCGISQVEDERCNLCYLTTRNNLKPYSDIQEMEEAILCKNPFLRTIFQESDFLFDKPEVINAFSFSPKSCVEHHLLMVGDAAGLITPLCGNGMAMAIHAAYIVTEVIKKFYSKNQSFDRSRLETEYQNRWQRQFARRLWAGRKLQALFGHPITTEIAVSSLEKAKPLASWLVKQTHGERF